MTDRISTDDLRKLMDEHHKGSLYSETLDRHKYDLAAEVIELRGEVERLREAIVSLRLDDDKREFDAFDSGWNAALDALQRKEGDE